MAFAPTRVKSFPGGSRYQTNSTRLSESIEDLEREKSMLEAHLSNLKVDKLSPIQNAAAIISEKMKIEEKIDELSFTIGDLQRELIAAQHEENSEIGLLRRGASYCETKQENKNAHVDVAAALAAFEALDIDEEDDNQDVKITGAEEPFNLHLITSEQGKHN